MEVIHDDNMQVDAILSQHNILSQKDLWHKCKNIMGKFKELLQEKRRTPQDSTVKVATTIAQRHLKYPELATHDLAYKLKSWIYTCAKNAALRGDTTPERQTMDIHNAADYWAGDHNTCRNLHGVQKCIVENWSGERKRKYALGGETHKAVKEFLKKYITESKMKCYIRLEKTSSPKRFILS
ncbi:hypothetical protein R1flu_005535 [Riccia fluitans]|uniref:Uncharacterized protein n=1 Tax=Riccia fluitans TaxID=41844 RepID=A0ABD1YU05_9MARC